MSLPVTILMGVRNGGPFLSDQLASLSAQDHANWHLVARDDGSADGSVAVLGAFARQHPVTLKDGPGQGFAANFLALLQDVPAGACAALSDQDDVWLPDKLSAGLAALKTAPPEKPALYCSRRWVWDPRTGRKQPSRRYPHAPDFGNALIENIAPGNTIMLNPAAARLARDTAPAARGIFAHDWWLYQLVTGTGGQVIWDPEPRLLYRQHAANALGAGESATQEIRNKGAVLRGVYAQRLGAQMAALGRIRDRLTPEARARLDSFDAARRAGFAARLGGLRRARVWRQGWLSGAGFWGAACLGRI